MRALAAIGGCCILVLVLVDAFDTVVLTRRTRHMFRIARLFYWLTWEPFAALSRRIHSSRDREAFLGVYWPLSLLFLLALWAIALVFAFGLLRWAVSGGALGNFFYISATTLFTLGSGDPTQPAGKLIAVAEGGLGLAFLGMVVGYLPVLYQSFSQRELRISLLDTRGGSPPSAGALLQSCPIGTGTFDRQLAVWEEWEAQLIETHVSFPMLAYFRSQHANQSWLTALVAMIDCAAIVSLCAEENLSHQASLTFAMGRHALLDTVVIFRLEKKLDHAPQRAAADHAKLTKILESKKPTFDPRLFSESKLSKLRQLYEPQACMLSQYFLMSLPAWISDSASQENWRVDLLERGEVPFAVSDPFSQSRATTEEEDRS
jgi:hypothetical protein